MKTVIKVIKSDKVIIIVTALQILASTQKQFFTVF
jgi:hypothetical protein